MKVPDAPPADPLVSRLRDPLFARAYQTWLDLLIDRAERVRPRRRRIVLPDRPADARPTSLAG